MQILSWHRHFDARLVRNVRSTQAWIRAKGAGSCRQINSRIGRSTQAWIRAEGAVCSHCASAYTHAAPAILITLIRAKRDPRKQQQHLFFQAAEASRRSRRQAWIRAVGAGSRSQTYSNIPATEDRNLCCHCFGSWLPARVPMRLHCGVVGMLLPQYTMNARKRMAWSFVQWATVRSGTFS